MKKDEKKKKNIFIKILIILLLIVASIYLYARFIGTKGLNTNEIPIINEALPASFNGLKIVHFTDIHFNHSVSKKDLKRIVDDINSTNPDIIVFTGDLFSNSKITEDEKKNIINEFKKTEAKLFKFAVYGDYDLKNKDMYKEIMEKCDFIILDNENKLIYKNNITPINIVGITEAKNISELYNDNFSITLTHKPDNTKNLNGNIVLSGHSLGGEIKLPFYDGLIKRDGAKTYINSYYKVDNKDLYISSGIGTGTYNLRLFNHPSINLYRLYNY